MEIIEMNKTLLIAGLAVATLAGAAGVAIAQDVAAPAQARPHHARGDADGDGRISQAEFVAPRLQRLTAADANRDGSVTREEMRAAGQARRAERTAARFDRLDADRDGALSRAEFTAARPMRGEHGRRGGRHGPRRMHGPGHAGKAERGPIAIADVQARREQAFTRLDADHDGFLTPDERRAGMRQARERMAQRRSERQASPQTPASE
jgi:Ca2+-binding EF-hand superfamily protein